MERRTVLAVGLSAAVALVACNGDDSGGPGKANEGPPAPSWDSVRIERAWLNEGFGEVSALGIADFDGDGSDDVVLGGRGIALLDRTARATHHPRWSFDWLAPDDQPLAGGDNDWVYEMELVSANDDGVPDVLAVTTGFDAYLIDGATGAAIWHRLLEGSQYPTGFALFDGDGDAVPDFFPVGGLTAYAGATGETLWQATLEGTAYQVRTARRADGPAGLFVTTADDQIGGGFGTAAAAPFNAVHALAADGTLLWTVPLDGSPCALAAGDLDGDGRDDAVISNWTGGFRAVDADGAPLFDLPFTDAFAPRLEADDLDDDGRAELLVEIVGADGSDRVEIVGADGGSRGGVALSAPAAAIVAAELDGVPPREVLIGSGEMWQPWGEVVALRPGARGTPEELWRVAYGGAITAFAPATVDGTRVLLAGSDQGWLLALAPETGESAWNWAAGRFVMELAAADLDGDGADEVVSGDDAGNVAVSSPGDGSLRWASRIDVGWSGSVRVLAAGPFEGTAPGVVAGGLGLYPELGAILERFDGDGTLRFSVHLDAEPTGLVLADLDADGAAELILAERPFFEGDCRVEARRADGTPLWATPINACELAHVAAGDVDGDGRIEIAYGDQTLGAMPRVALLGPDGALRWSVESPEDTWWIAAVPGAAVTLGRADAFRGHATRFAAADGTPVWQAFLAPVPDPEMPDLPLEGTARLGTLVPDLDGDGFDELAAASDSGAVHFLDGATGAERWQARVEPEGLPVDQRHFAGPLAYVPGSAVAPPFLAVGQTSIMRMRARTLVLDLDGHEIGSIAQEGEAHGIVPVRFDADRRGAAIGAGLGVYALEPRNVEPAP